MKYKILKMNDDNKIIFTKQELTDLLDEVYTDGYRDGNRHWYTWTSPTITPSWQYSPTITTSSTSDDSVITTPQSSTDSIRIGRIKI